MTGHEAVLFVRSASGYEDSVFVRRAESGRTTLCLFAESGRELAGRKVAGRKSTRVFSCLEEAGRGVQGYLALKNAHPTRTPLGRPHP